MKEDYNLDLIEIDQYYIDLVLLFEKKYNLLEEFSNRENYLDADLKLMDYLLSNKIVTMKT